MAQQQEQPKIFDHLANYLTATTMLEKTPSDKNLEFYQQLVTAKNQLDKLIDEELHKIASEVKV